MGADLISYVLWTTESRLGDRDRFDDLLVDMLTTVSDALAAAPGATLVAVDEWLQQRPEAPGNASEAAGELVAAVLDADPSAAAKARERLLVAYQGAMTDFLSTFCGSREVDARSYGPATMWLTAGMSWGDSPTDAFDSWCNILDPESHPLAEVVFDRLFFDPAGALAEGLPVTA